MSKHLWKLDVDVVNGSIEVIIKDDEEVVLTVWDGAMSSSKTIDISSLQDFSKNLVWLLEDYRLRKHGDRSLSNPKCAHSVMKENGDYLLLEVNDSGAMLNIQTMAGTGCFFLNSEEFTTVANAMTNAAASIEREKNNA